ncbi:class I adenylate-forming enzyme family protein [Natrinema gelatinilyticum]|uniref:class I adenylate-forming enzyme family protein n=1 Tax=Natrinema gelatinilyticum TaxID=2961571 RepID=UPI0020C346C7|nr:AMP-binding protein [Natrinema gelatinilyticum]
MLLGRILDQAATRWPDADAMVQGERLLTYDEWNRRVDRVATALADRGVDPGDRVGILTRNRIEQATAYFAAQRRGAVAVPMNFRLSPDDLVHLVTTAKTSVLLYDEEVADCVADVRSDLTPVEYYFSTGANPDLGEPFAALGTDAPATAPDDGDVDPTDLAVMMHTSGTTGRPKLVETDHRSVWANAMACLSEFDYWHTDRVLHVAPMFHSADYLNVLVPNVLVGATNVMQPQFDPERTLELFESESITVMLGVPTHLKRLMAVGADGYDCSSLRLVLSTGAPVPDDVTEWITTELSEHNYNVYGLTETTGMVTLRDPTIPAARPDDYCIGKPFLNVDVRLIELGEDAAPTDTVETGERGRLIVRAPKLMHGYYEQPEKTKATLHGEWLYTNDIALLGEDGRYYMFDRIDNVVISGGENVYPLEVERTLRTHSDIADCAVTGEPDDDLGERIVAYVVPADESLTEDDIEDYWRYEQTAVADYKRPRAIHFVDELPEVP